MPTPIPAQAILFDLDGVLTDTARYHFVAWQALASSLGIEFTHALNERLKGVDRMGSLDLILQVGAFSLDPELKRELADRKNEHYLQLVAGMTPSNLLPGALQALDAARAAGLKVGLCSASRNALQVLGSLGILDRFDAIADPAAVAHGKPAPDIFLEGARLLGVPPAACVGVEDAMAGVQAIKAAGMYAVGVGDPQVLAQADEVVPSLLAFDVARYLAPAPDAAMAGG